MGSAVQTMSVLQPLLHRPPGDLGQVTPVGVFPGALSMMTAADKLFNTVLSFTPSPPSASYSVVAIGTSLWANRRMDVATVRERFSVLYQGAYMVFLDRGIPTTDSRPAGLEQSKQNNTSVNIFTVLGRLAAVAPIRLVTAFFSSNASLSSAGHSCSDESMRLQHALHCASPGAEVRVVVPISSIENNVVAEQWSQLPCVHPEFSRHEFLFVPPGATISDMQSIAVFRGTIASR